MMLNLSGPIIQPRDGRPASLLVLLHGYGSDGQDLIGLSPLFADLLNNPVIFAPDAPEACPLNPMSYQWFPLAAASDFESLHGIDEAALTIQVLLESLWAETGLGPAETLLAGFSQGGMLSLYSGLMRDAPLAGILSFSGGLPLDAEFWPEIRSRPPMLLVHGDMDDVVPMMMSIATADALVARGLAVTRHISPGCPHAIAPDSIEAARRFVAACLPLAGAAT
ncbi:MAG: prolyl oligopeptidase family serine peptidase [Alphaproteobacteria bacterium]|nr:prolyl oligopeptidase family serine peptidase [Alphaproteobacteria bacterium]